MFGSVNSMDINPQWLKRAVDNRQQEQFIQQNKTIMSNNSKCFLYKKMKADHKFEEYLVKIPKIFSVPILKLRSCNHKLSIEKGRYSNVPRERRHCELCDENRPFVGDEYHFLLHCKNTQLNQFMQVSILQR